MELKILNNDELKILKDNNKLSLTWLENNEHLNELDSINYKILINNNFKAVIAFSFVESLEAKNIEIDLFEVFEKGNGYGTQIVNELKSECNKISLYFYSEKSLDFWKKMILY